MPGLRAFRERAIERPFNDPLSDRVSRMTAHRNDKTKPDMTEVAEPVSYTHLDVYKRQVWGSMEQKTGLRLPTSHFRRKTPNFRDTRDKVEKRRLGVALIAKWH